MSAQPPFVFAMATADWEFEQIHRLNHATFAEEIPQHRPSPDCRLVDQFHGENTYLICRSGRTLAGMLAVRSNRPFSLDKKLDNLDSFLPHGRRVCEVRLLAIDQRFRGSPVLRGLLGMLRRYAIAQGFDLGIISATPQQLKLYRHLGFVPFGPLVGSVEARFQPMYVLLEAFETATHQILHHQPHATRPSVVSFLPGPVTVRRPVRQAFAHAPESHRTDRFVEQLESTKRILCACVGARRAELLLGSGTLANDVIVGQLSLESRRGIVLSNGEFGDRLIDQAQRFQLDFDTMAFPWGEPFDYRALRHALAGVPTPSWVFGTHCETSTGVLNDLAKLQTLCADYQVRLCLDCISTIGTMPVDLSGVYLASCVSGKGLGAYSGLSMVFSDHDVLPQPKRLPRYLDLGLYAQQQGVPFTFSSNLLGALDAAVRGVDWNQRFVQLGELSTILDTGLRDLGYERVGRHTRTSPAVFTIALPTTVDSVRFGYQLEDAGYLVSFNSQYLRRRNWFQVCLMGECTSHQLARFLSVLPRAGGLETRSPPP